MRRERSRRRRWASLPLVAVVGVVANGHGVHFSPIFLWVSVPFALSAGGVAWTMALRARKRAAEELERRRNEREARETARAEAIARGAEPGQLAVAAPEDGAGDLSLQTRDGAVSLAKKQSQ